MARGPDRGRSGIAVVDKAAGWTSHDVVARARRILSTRRVGHAGTLDPDATGVLVLGIGSATRLMRFLGDLSKSYTAEIVLGVETTTLDASGDVVATWDCGHVTPEDVAKAAAGLTGDIRQTPPMVSAVHVQGRRLYELAREGKEVQRVARPVTVHRFDVSPVDTAGPHPRYRAEITCSSGTYVRVLASDLGASLGAGGHLAWLRRSAVGSFTLDQARPIESLEVLPPAAALGHLEAVTLAPDEVPAVGNGRVLERDERFTGPGPWAVLDPAGELVAVYEARGAERVKPSVVLAG